MVKPATEARQQFKELLDRPWFIVVLILHVGFLGIPLYWRTKYSLGVRVMIVVASIAYTVGAVACIVWMLRALVRMFTAG